MNQNLDDNLEGKNKQENVALEKPGKQQRPDYVFPLLLITLGVLFLLYELGVSINWSVIWPIFLIVIGLGMIISRRTSGLWVALIILLVIVSIFFAFILAPAFSVRLGETKTYTDNLSQDGLEGVTSINFKYQAPVGRLEIKPDFGSQSEPIKLITTTNIEELPPVSINKEGKSLSIEASYSPRGAWIIVPWLSNWEKARLDRTLFVGTSFPLFLDLDMTSGKVIIDTSGIPIEEAKLHFTSGELAWDAGKSIFSLSPLISLGFTSGTAHVYNLGATNFSDLEINFTSGHGEFDLSGISAGAHKVSVGLTSGSVKLQAPGYAGYRVRVEKTSGNVVVGGRSFNDGEFFESQNYRSALVKIDFSFGLTSGDIAVTFTD